MSHLALALTALLLVCVSGEATDAEKIQVIDGFDQQRLLSAQQPPYDILKEIEQVFAEMGSLFNEQKATPLSYSSEKSNKVDL